MRRAYRLITLFATCFFGIVLGYACHARWPFEAVRRYVVAMQILNALYGFTVLDYHLIEGPSGRQTLFMVPTALLLGLIGVMYCFTLSNVITWNMFWADSMRHIAVSWTVGEEVLTLTAPDIMTVCAVYSVATIAMFVVNSFFIFVRPFSNK